MGKIPRGSVGKTIWAVMSIILITVFCTAISSAGIYLASRLGLTQSREQVPLTALYLGNGGKVELPGRGKIVERNGWGPRSSRDNYTLTLDDAVIGNAAEKNVVEKDTFKENTVMENMESPQPGIGITGDLTVELKEGSGSWIRSEGAGIRIRSGTLVIRGKGNLGIEVGTAGILGSKTGNSQAALRLGDGQLDVKGTYAGIPCPEVGIAGGASMVLASGQSGIGFHSYRLRVGESEGGITVEGNHAAVLAGGSRGMEPSMKAGEKATTGPGNVRIVRLDAARLESAADHEEEIGGWMEGIYSSLLTYSSEDMVTYNEGTLYSDGSAETIRFAAK